MAYTQEQIDALKKAIALGATRVRYADRDVEYRSLEEMKEILGDMIAEVEGASGTRRTRKTHFQTSRGF